MSSDPVLRTLNALVRPALRFAYPPRPGSPFPRFLHLAPVAVLARLGVWYIRVCQAFGFTPRS